MLATEGKEGVAIVGMACRLPGRVSDPETFWELLVNQRCARGQIPKRSFYAEAFYHPQNKRPGSFRYQQGYYIDNDLEHFDAAFFGMSSAEVQALDPQQRQLLECCFDAFESGGITLDQLSDTSTGVYVGSFASDYETQCFKEPERIEGMMMLGMGRTTIANRISYMYNLKGPSVTMDTACSSTMYALHFAVQALRAGEIPAAVVAGTNLMLSPEFHFAITQIGALSPTAMCHTFDESADGYARGESVNVLYLKRVSDALRDGDPIRAIIRGTALTANGKNNGITLPSASSQQLCIQNAWADAGLTDFGSLGYFECHGTGTAVGDPIETLSISNIFADHFDATQPLLIGSAKPQIGHGESGSAISSIIKVVLAMEKGVLPGTFGIQKLNPNLHLRDGKITVLRENRPWPQGKARRACVNSSGYGGANGCCVLDSLDQYLRDRDAVDTGVKTNTSTNSTNGNTHGINYGNATRKTNNKPLGNSGYTSGHPRRIIAQSSPALPRHGKMILPLSSHDEYSLIQSLQSMQETLTEGSYLPQDLVHTMITRRSRFSHRAAIAFSVSEDQVVEFCQDASRGKIRLSEPTVAFVFTGQGAQWAEMGKKLIGSFTCVRATLSKLSQRLAELQDAPPWTLEEVLLAPTKHSRMSEAAISQPACTAIQIAMVDLLREWGVRPVATVGHSSGEIGAAYAADLISAGDAIIAAYLRGLYAERITKRGAMMAVACSPDSAVKILQDHGIDQHSAVLACHNAPDSVTLSGDEDAIDRLQRSLKENSILCKKLETGGKAYHSRHVQEVGSQYKDAVLASETTVRKYPATSEGASISSGQNLTSQKYCRQTSAIMVSSVSLKKLGYGDAGASYWQANMESPVRFDGAIRKLLELGFGREERRVDCLIEIGPHSALQGAIRQIISSNEVKETREVVGASSDVLYLPSLMRNNDSEDDVLALASALFILGYPIDLLKVNSLSSYRPERPLTGLPGYVWNHQTKHPLQLNRATSDYKFATHARHDLIGSRLPGGSRMVPTWRNYFRLQDVPWIADHTIGKTVIVPGAAYIAMAIEAAAQYVEDESLGVSTFKFEGARFHLRTVDIKAAMVLEEDGTADVLISLRATEASATINWFDFHISSFVGGRWLEHASGAVACEAAGATKPSRSSTFAWNDEEKNTVFEQVTSKAVWYQRLERAGFHFGPTLQVLDHIETGNHLARMRATAPILKRTTSMPQDDGTLRHGARYAVHPISIDALLQSVVVAACDGRVEKMVGTPLPVFVEELVIQSPVWPYGQTGIVDTLSWPEGARTGGAHSRLTTQDGIEIVSMKGVRWRLFNSLGGKDSSSESRERLLFHRLQWKPDLQLLDHPNFQDLQEVVDLLAHKNPRMRILELGSRTGEACTRAVLNTLTDCGRAYGARYADYTVTNPDAEVLEVARQTLVGHYPALEYRPLDISQLPFKQSFTVGHYHLIVAHDLLTYTGTNYIDVLRNCRALMRSGGQMLLCESTLFQDVPSHDLRQSGFDGSAILLHKGLESLGLRSVLLVTAADNAVHKAQGFTTLPISTMTVCILCTSSQQHLATSISQLLADRAEARLHVVFQTLATLTTADLVDEPTNYIVLEELEQPVLLGPSQAQFDGLKKMVQTASLILWVTAGDLLAGGNPIMAMVRGIAGTAMNEESGRNLRFATLDVDSPSAAESERLARHVLSIYSSVAKVAGARVASSESSPCDTSYLLKDDVVHISRLVPDIQLSGEYGEDNGDGRLEQRFPASGNTQLAFASPGLLDSLYFRQLPETSLGPDEVEIEVTAVGLNMKDYMIAMGNFEATKSSNEATGVVRQVGSRVSDLAVGDKVISLHRGLYDTYLRCPAAKCFKLRSDDDLIMVASVSIAYCTTLYGLKYLAQLEDGETILIQTATGSLGLAAIEYARAVGAEVYCTVGTPEKRAYLVEKMGIPDHRIFWSRSIDFAPALKEQTAGRGVDVILSTISGPGFLESLRCLAPCGRFIDVGRGNVLKKGNLSLQVFDKSTSIFSFDLSFILDEKPKMARRALRDMMDLLHAGLVNPIPIAKTFHISEMENALRFFGQATHIGKIVLTYGPTGTTVKLRGMQSPQAFRPESSYLLSGCHGGLGHSIASWMIDRGARKLVFISRSPETKAETAAFVHRARARGVHLVTVQGDVADQQVVREAVLQAVTLGPLRGVVHAAMVLDDAFLHTMTLDQYQNTVRPKVLGALNLHHATIEAGADLEFFFMTSSSAALVGHVSQAHYAAANCVLDYLARHRRSMGLAATSVALGAIIGAGILEKKPEYREYARRAGLSEISEAEFVQYFESFLRHQDASSHFDRLTQGYIVAGFAYTGDNIRSIDTSRLEEDPRAAILVNIADRLRSVEAGSTGDANRASHDDIVIPASQKEAIPLISSAIAQRLGKLLLIAPEDIDQARTLSHLGIDSMSGSELIHWLRKKFSVTMSFLELLAPTCSCRHLARVIYNAAHKKET